MGRRENGSTFSIGKRGDSEEVVHKVFVPEYVGDYGDCANREHAFRIANGFDGGVVIYLLDRMLESCRRNNTCDAPVSTMRWGDDSRSELTCRPTTSLGPCPNAEGS